ncbi:unnamed protein product [Zymoseptoria tritici ST99CH_3D1]|uniref:Uncharacterized protein n=1 Tax=Zymoseptoria tritici ST99CH_1E4 TaxID=1276532 RepID=A0A2H1H8T1_ZYMTR|nr:unnamed protein product [Zymoseptoria tritici ST99CH_1E4]SMR64667.1 unnamed protein product [Zymoseptoria tritici ST99CH_3D1]
MFTKTTILALLASTAMVLAAPADSPSATTESSCTIFVTAPAPECGCDVPGQTATSYTDCGGCALSTTYAGPICLAECVPQTTLYDETTTVTACEPTPTYVPA